MSASQACALASCRAVRFRRPHGPAGHPTRTNRDRGPVPAMRSGWRLALGCTQQDLRRAEVRASPQRPTLCRTVMTRSKEVPQWPSNPPPRRASCPSSPTGSTGDRWRSCRSTPAPSTIPPRARSSPACPAAGPARWMPPWPPPRPPTRPGGTCRSSPAAASSSPIARSSTSIARSSPRSSPATMARPSLMPSRRSCAALRRWSSPAACRSTWPA